MIRRISTIAIGLLIGGASSALSAAQSEESRPIWADAIAAWHLADLNDSAGKNSQLTASGEKVEVGVALSGQEREDSLARGGDGQVATFDGGWLSAEQGADGELNLPGNTLSICMRLRNPSGQWKSPLFSKHGGGDKLTYNLFAGTMGPRQYLRFELGTDGNRPLPSMRAPLDNAGADRWHDVILSCDGAKVQLYVDGVWQDEDFLVGNFRQGNPVACLIGGEAIGDKINVGFRGLVDHVLVWNRPLTLDEIVTLSGGPKVVAARRKALLPPSDAPMQYFKTPYEDWNVGDCLPFYHDGVFHFYYLTDKRHHGSKNGLGAHQWAHSSSRDLVHWEHHPLAVPISEPWEGSICTGSVFWHDGTYYAFYSTRKADRSGEYLSLATSSDGIHFEKQKPNPLAGPEPPYVVGPFRDPHVFRADDGGPFHLILTARLKDYPLKGREDCLAHLVSTDLRHWEQQPPFFVTGYTGGPECAEHFAWNGWYYLVSSNQGVARYRMSRSPLGPWTRPAVDEFGGPEEKVMKSAAFNDNRRLGTAWIGKGGWAGNAVFREFVQHPDGTLGTRFPSEMVPPSGSPVALNFTPVTQHARREGSQVRVNALDGFGVGMFDGMPHNALIRMRVVPQSGTSYFGIGVRGSGNFELGNSLRLAPLERKVVLEQPQSPPRDGDQWRSLTQVEALDRPITLELVMKDDLIDVCIDQRRTMINRVSELQGDRLFLYAFHGDVTFDAIEVRPLK